MAATLLDSADAKDMGRLDPWPQGDIIALAPGVLDAVKQIFNQEAFIRGTADLVEIEIGPAGLFVE